VVATTGDRFAVNLISAVTAKGKLRFAAYDGNLNGPVFQIAGDRGHRVGVLADRRHASARARSVSTARGRIAAGRSVQVWALQAGS
jgi:hypothetical protein